MPESQKMLLLRFGNPSESSPAYIDAGTAEDHRWEKRRTYLDDLECEMCGEIIKNNIHWACLEVDAYAHYHCAEVNPVRLKTASQIEAGDRITRAFDAVYALTQYHFRPSALDNVGWYGNFMDALTVDEIVTVGNLFHLRFKENISVMSFVHPIAVFAVFGPPLD